MKINYDHVSIIIPCRNEDKYIARCLDSVISNDYPKDKLEVLIVDGMSEDHTKTIVEEYVKNYNFIKLLANPMRITPVAFNIGIKHSTGNVIMIMGAHATYEKDYISKCIYYLNTYKTDNVGGMWKIKPRDNTLVGRAIALISSSPFGVGNAYYRTGNLTGPKWVDTVFGGCYRKKVFDQIGLFNEKLVRTQDLELNSRLRKFGGKVLLVPEIVSYYYTRSDIKSFIKYIFVNSMWVTYPKKYLKDMPVSLRHLIPMFFVLSIITNFILSFFSMFFLVILLLIIGSYIVTDLIFTLRIVFREKDIKLAIIILWLFPMLHFSYGFGSIWGFIKSFDNT
jgi:glycosyltransferase involved in cell wall biosynthesis